MFDPAIAGLGVHIITAAVTDGNGCTGTNQLSIDVQDCLSIENLFYNGVSIQPNPSNGNFVINGLEQGSTFTIYDMNGKVILTKIVDAQIQEVKLENVHSGIYYLQTIKSGRLGQMKFAVL
jgi:hypothetical protein